MIPELGRETVNSYLDQSIPLLVNSVAVEGSQEDFVIVQRCQETLGHSKLGLYLLAVQTNRQLARGGVSTLSPKLVRRLIKQEPSLFDAETRTLLQEWLQVRAKHKSYMKMNLVRLHADSQAFVAFYYSPEVQGDPEMKKDLQGRLGELTQFYPAAVLKDYLALPPGTVPLEEQITFILPAADRLGRHVDPLVRVIADQIADPKFKVTSNQRLVLQDFFLRFRYTIPSNQRATIKERLYPAQKSAHEKASTVDPERQAVEKQAEEILKKGTVVHARKLLLQQGKVNLLSTEARDSLKELVREKGLKIGESWWKE